jgi:hypothetical protein
MSDTTYNGWTNYETWCVNLWIDNEQGTQEEWAENARECLKDADFDKDAALSNLADMLKDTIEDNAPILDGVFSDLLRAALGSVDWREIAQNMLSDIEVYSAGWNMPGYMPESEPAMFLDDSDARAYISDEMDSAAEGEENSETVKALENASISLLKGSGEYGQTIGQYHYFVNKV